MAPLYPKVKFVKMVATKCIEKLADESCPSMLIYKNGEVFKQLIPLKLFVSLKGITRKGKNREITNSIDLIKLFGKLKVIEVEEEDEEDEEEFKILAALKSRGKDKEEGGSDEEGDREYSNNQYWKYKAK